jgi:hypothetical protein
MKLWTRHLEHGHDFELLCENLGQVVDVEIELGAEETVQL